MHLAQALATSLSRHFCSLPRPGQKLRQPVSSQFNGVCWSRHVEKFRAEVSVAGKKHAAGSFLSELEAAHAYDQRLRELCQDPVRLKKSLNFPTQTEASFTESSSDARVRGLSVGAFTGMAEAESFRLLQARFSTSGLATTYEIVQVPGASRVDAIFRPKSSSVGGLCLQLKAANSSGNRGMSYAFQHTQGYAGMLLLLVPLDLDILWAVPGSRITQTGVQVTLGSKRDRSWRVLELGRTLEWFLHQPATFPHVTFSDAALQSCEAHLLEAKAHNLMAKALSSVNCHLIRSGIASAPVDSRIRTGTHTWDVQEKATRLQKSGSVGRYMANLFRNGGALGRLAYDEHDFDVLLVAILEGEALLGMFMFPVHVLAARGLVGHKPMQLALYPPWKLPVKKGCRLKQAWQLDYFIGLQDWDGDSSLCKQAQSRLLELVQRLPPRKNTFCRSDSRMDADGKQVPCIVAQCQKMPNPSIR